jgi:hypothetical protein
MLSVRARPLADLVIDEDVQRWDRWLEYRRADQRSALHCPTDRRHAPPATSPARWPASQASSADYSLVTEAITDAVSESVHAEATYRKGIR